LAIKSQALRSPLTAIDGYASLIEERLDDGPDDLTRQHLRCVDEGVQHMRQLLDGLSSPVLLKDGDARLEPCDAGEVVARVLRLFEPEAQRAGATLEAGPMPVVLADAGRLAQVFQNLVGNALKFRSSAPPRVRIEAETSGGEARFAVHDNGVGIALADLDRVFEPFVRLRSVEALEGYGIGLSVCRMAVESMGGRIRAEARPGGGTTFRFTLKLAPGASPGG
jgi:signal transduction histidine kinase